MKRKISNKYPSKFQNSALTSKDCNLKDSRVGTKYEL